MSMADHHNAVRRSEFIGALPPEWNDPDLFTAIQKDVHRSGRKVVVLDDDPTGTQTVHGVNLLTEWSVERLRAEFAEPSPLFYILTNSRSLSRDEAFAMNVEIATNMARVSRNFDVVSRSDST